MEATMSDSSPFMRVQMDSLVGFAEAVLERAGVTRVHRERVADALVRADLRGVDSHGVARLETYIANFEGGGFNPDPEIRVERVGDGTALVDADDGPGQTAGVVAMDEAMAMADDCGIGASFVSRSNHFGTAAYYTQRAAEADYVGIAATNVGSDVAPFGGSDAVLGTNPISYAVPSNQGFPITLDMATSVVAMGKIDHVASAEGTDIPDDWALDEDGEPTTDPDAVKALRPVGGPKGYGLAIGVDVLCGLLSGARTSPEIGPLYDEFDESMELGHFMLALDVSQLVDPDVFRELVDQYAARLKTTATRDGFDEVLLPGEPEARAREENERRGVPISKSTFESLEHLAAEHDLELPEPAIH